MSSDHTYATRAYELAGVCVARTLLEQEEIDVSGHLLPHHRSRAAHINEAAEVALVRLSGLMAMRRAEGTDALTYDAADYPKAVEDFSDFDLSLSECAAIVSTLAQVADAQLTVTWPAVEALSREFLSPVFPARSELESLTIGVFERWDVARSYVLAGAAIVHDFLGNTVDELTLNLDDEDWRYGDATVVNFHRLGAEFIDELLRYRSQVHGHEVVFDKMRDAAAQYRHGQASEVDLSRALFTWQRAVDAEAGRILDVCRKALVGLAETIAVAVLAGEISGHRATSLVMTDRSSRVSVLMRFAMAAEDADEAANRLESAAEPAECFVELFWPVITVVADALRSARTLDGTTFRELIADLQSPSRLAA